METDATLVHRPSEHIVLVVKVTANRALLFLSFSAQRAHHSTSIQSERGKKEEEQVAERCLCPFKIFIMHLLRNTKHPDDFSPWSLCCLFFFLFFTDSVLFTGCQRTRRPAQTYAPV